MQNLLAPTNHKKKRKYKATISSKLEIENIWQN